MKGHTHHYEKWVFFIMLTFINSFDKFKIQTKNHKTFSSEVILYLICNCRNCVYITLAYISSFDTVIF